MNFQMFKLDVERAEEPGIKLQTFVGSLQKQESFRKTSTSASLTMLKPLTVWITTNCGKFLKRRKYQTTSPASWETCMRVKKKQNWIWKTDWFKIAKGEWQACILSPCLFNLYAEYIMWNAGLDESQAGIKIVGKAINMQMTSL